MSTRYAIYYAPQPGSILDGLGREWLGRNAWTNEPVAQPAIAGIEESTAEPRRYGFHATLKAPFYLDDGCTGSDLLKVAADIGRYHPPVTIASLTIAEIGGFVALVPEIENDDLRLLATACVKELDRFRAPLRAAEFDRRRSAGLTQRQQQLTRNWGYPFVLDEFRFHMTLTGNLAEAQRGRIREMACVHFDEIIGRPLIIDALTIFAEPSRGGPFVAQERFPLTGATETVWPEIWKFGAR